MLKLLDKYQRGNYNYSNQIWYMEELNMKFCSNCGSQMMDDANVCPSCGTAIAPVNNGGAASDIRQKASNIGAAIKNYDYEGLVPDAIKEKVPSKYRKFVPFAFLAIILVVVILLLSMCTGGYKKPVKYWEQELNGKFKNVSKTVPKEVWEDYLDMIDMDEDEYIEQLEDVYDNTREYYEDEYGDNYKIRIKVTDKKELSDRKLKAIKDGLKDNYDINKKDVKKAYELDYEYKIKGSEDEDEDDGEIIVVKIKGKWYKCTSSGTLEVSPTADSDSDNGLFDEEYDY